MELQESDFPRDIFVKCKLPAPAVIRGFLALLIGTLVAAALYNLLKMFAAPSPGFNVVWLVAFGACVYRFGEPLWDYLRENMRSCAEYDRFVEYYKQEMLQTGMTKELAINDAKEKIMFDRKLAHANRNLRRH